MEIPSSWQEESQGIICRKKTRNDGTAQLKLDWSHFPEEDTRRQVHFHHIGVDEKYEQCKRMIVFSCPHQKWPYYYWQQTHKLTTNLKELYLRKCKFKRLPSSIENLENLEILHVHNCDSLYFIPESIFERLQRLKCLSIEYCCDLKNLPSSIGQLASLTKLTIHSCPISVLPASIGRLRNLEQLELKYLEVKALPNELGNLTNLKRLFFEKSKVKLPSLIFDPIKDASNLEHLYLEASIDVLNSIPLFPRLLSLALLFREPYHDNLKILNNAWRDCSTLRELRINTYGFFNINILSNLPRTLQKLSFEDCKINQLLDSLTDEFLPPGLLMLTILSCNRPSYSTSERIDCIRTLAEKYPRLGRIRISENDIVAGSRPLVYQLVQPPLPIKETYLLKYNRCGRILVESSSGDNNERTSSTALVSGANKRQQHLRKSLPQALWPTVMARVHDMVFREIHGYSPPHKEKELQEIEASILFRFLQGGGFLEGLNKSIDENQIIVVGINKSDNMTPCKRKINDCLTQE